MKKFQHFLKFEMCNVNKKCLRVPTKIKNKRRLKRRKAKEKTTIGETKQTVTALHEYSHLVFLSFIFTSS